MKEDEIKCNGEPYKTKIPLKSTFHWLAYRIECKRRAQEADSVIQPQMGRGHSNLCEANIKVLLKTYKDKLNHSLRNAYIRTRFFMFSLKNSTLPSKFNNLFPINSQIYNYNTRNVHSFRLPPCRTNYRHFSIYFQGPKFYNSLNSTITGPSSSTSFKRKLKEFFLSTY